MQIANRQSRAMTDTSPDVSHMPCPKALGPYTHAVPALKRWAFLCRARGAVKGRSLARRAITGDTALRLAQFFGTTPEFWLNLQSLYEIRLTEQKSGKSIKALPTLRRAPSAPFKRSLSGGFDYY